MAGNVLTIAKKPLLRILNHGKKKYLLKSMATTLLKDKILNHLNNIKSTKLKKESLNTSISNPKHLKNCLQTNPKTQSHKNRNLNNFRR